MSLRKFQLRYVSKRWSYRDRERFAAGPVVNDQRLHLPTLVGAAGGTLPLHPPAPLLAFLVVEPHLSAQLGLEVLQGQVTSRGEEECRRYG